MRRIVDRSAEADANAFHAGALDPGLFQKLGDASHDLPADAFGAGLDVYGFAPQAAQHAVTQADAELKFAAADFHADVHGESKRNAKVQVVHDPVKGGQVNRFH